MAKLDTFGRRAVLSNGLLLILPPTMITFGLWAALPPAYGAEHFWKDIPAWLGLFENVFRVLVFSLPAILYFGRQDELQRRGWYLHLGGLLAYLASYLAQIIFPDSGWSTNVIGFSAPAWTTLFWLIGIGLVCARSWLRIPWSRSIYVGCAVLFLMFHTAHTLLVYAH
jgi:hypothetical protein